MCPMGAQQDMPTDREVIVLIRSIPDIVTARQSGCRLAVDLGLTAIDAGFVSAAVSELARNILLYAGLGEIVIGRVQRGQQDGIVVTARDDGPGIVDVARAMEDGFSTSGLLGLGLPGVKRLMDEFAIRSEPGHGTTVTAVKWK